MPFGVVALLVVAILVYFGVLHRVLDRMRLDDRTALLILLLMIVGSFFNLTILRQPPLIINLGGALVPIGIAVYLIATADTAREKVRGTMAALVAGAVIYLGFKFLNPEEQTMLIEPTYFFAVVAAVVGYLAGRSRRASFVAGTMGIVIADIAHYVEVVVTGVRGQTWIGGAGVFDSAVIAGLLAVALAEIVGETRELMTRGPLRSGRSGRNAEGGPDRGGGERRGEHGTGGSDERFTAALGPTEEERVRPVTSGGAGWEPPLLGDEGNRRDAAHRESGGDGGSKTDRSERDELTSAEETRSTIVTEPGSSPATGAAGVELMEVEAGESDLTGRAGLPPEREGPGGAAKRRRRRRSRRSPSGADGGEGDD